MRTQKWIRCLCFVLFLSSCGIQEKTGQQTSDLNETSASEAVTEGREYPAYTLDLGGESFHMIFFDAAAACGWSPELPYDIDEPEQTGDILADAVYERNRKIENMYNCKIVGIPYEQWDLQKEISKNTLAGTQAYDAVFPQWQIMNALITQNLLLELNDVFDLSRPWWDIKAEEAFRIGGKTYAVSGDLTFMDKLSDIVIFFNQQMVKDFALGDIYQMVIDHQWTLDQLIEMSRLVSADLDNNGKFNKYDRYGLSAQDDGLYELYNSAGERFCSIDEQGIPYYSANNERSVTVLTKIYEFMNDASLYFNRQKESLTVAECITMFQSDQVLFLMRPLQTVMELRSMHADFGIIPTPLFEEEQEQYHTPIGYTVAISTCIPMDCKNEDISAKILDTLAAESYYELNEVFYDMVLGSKVTRDSKSVENLDIIFDNHFLDPGEIYQFGGVANKMMANWRNAETKVASTLTKFEPKVIKDIESFMEIISKPVKE